MVEIITLLAICLQVADGWTTFIILYNGGKEVNKVMNYLINKIGLNLTLILTKGTAIGLIVFLYSMDELYILEIITAWYAWVVFHNIKEITGGNFVEKHIINIHNNKCTCWFNGWFGKSWADACQLHDDRYMTVMGKGMTRLQCDLELKTNVAKTCKLMSYVMYLGVRLFGWYYWDKFKEMRK